jgi:hypothetical protein
LAEVIDIALQDHPQLHFKSAAELRRALKQRSDGRRPPVDT